MRIFATGVKYPGCSDGKRTDETQIVVAPSRSAVDAQRAQGVKTEATQVDHLLIDDQQLAIIAPIACPLARSDPTRAPVEVDPDVLLTANVKLGEVAKSRSALLLIFFGICMPSAMAWQRAIDPAL